MYEETDQTVPHLPNRNRKLSTISHPPSVIAAKPQQIWVVNPFDPLPNESDVSLRYWALCRTFAEQGHEVIWWSSDFSHLVKSKRQPCPDTDGFSVRLIETPPYTKNVSITRLKNHRAFASGFYRDAMNALKSGELHSPDRIVVSLPPLGVAEQAFRIRASCMSTTTSRCEVVVDIQDAWPESFYRVLPRIIPTKLQKQLLKPIHHSARNAYLGADKISAVGQSYLDLAQHYTTDSNQQAKPTHLCYLGAESPNTAYRTPLRKVDERLQLIYIGAMEIGYDLETLILAASETKRNRSCQISIHMCGSGSLKTELRKMCNKYKLTNEDVKWHGYLKQRELASIMSASDVGIVPNRLNTHVACPNKACHYAAHGLPMISCLGGELEDRKTHV